MNVYFFPIQNIASGMKRGESYNGGFYHKLSFITNYLLSLTSQAIFDPTGTIRKNPFSTSSDSPHSISRALGADSTKQ